MHEVNALDRIVSCGGNPNVVAYFGNWIKDDNMFIAVKFLLYVIAHTYLSLCIIRWSTAHQISELIGEATLR